MLFFVNVRRKVIFLYRSTITCKTQMVPILFHHDNSCEILIWLRQNNAVIELYHKPFILLFYTEFSSETI